MRNGQINWDEFEEFFKPKANHILGEDEAPCNGWMYETFGDEMAHVLSVYRDPDPAVSDTVWTVTEADGIWEIAPGLHYVNRMGYVITEVPHTNYPQVCAVDEDCFDNELDPDNLDDELDEDLNDSPGPM